MTNITSIPQKTAPPKTTMVPQTAPVEGEAKPPQEIPLDPLLAKILSTKRAHESTGDKNFRLWLFSHLKGLGANPEIKSGGNILAKVGKGGTTLFSCHVDTVHGMAESDGSMQQLNYDPVFGHVFLADKKASGCLGGDDGVGIYIMLKMIEAKKLGWYMFHVGEERGGIGSNQFVKDHQQLIVDNFEAVVAFDRPVKDDGKAEVILTQGGKRCASDTYGLALAAELNKFAFNDNYAISHAGLFTDSKVYSNLVPECVNLGCFYDRQHTPEEYVDVGQVEILLEAALGIDWQALPIVREPAAEPVSNKGGYDKSLHGFNRTFDGFDDFRLADLGKPKVPQKAKTPPPSLSGPDDLHEALEELPEYSRADYVGLAVSDPDFTGALMGMLVAENEAMKAQLRTLKNFMSQG